MANIRSQKPEAANQRGNNSIRQTSKDRVQIVPAVLAADIEAYNRIIDNLAKFSPRISIDLSDGEFTPQRTINLAQVHWPNSLKVDLHLMYKNPSEHIATVISLNPSLAVIHAEAVGDKLEFIKQLKSAGIKAGVAILQNTSPAEAATLIAAADQVLIFAGSLGSYGGKFDPSQLTKAAEIRAINGECEICWDGGVTDANIKQIVAAGVNVINSGGFIANAKDPKAAYNKLLMAANL